MLHLPYIYLAGPEVFYPNAIEIGIHQKLLCKFNGYEGLFPLDNTVDQTLPKSEQAKLIVEGNMRMIEQADIILADLSNFRGSIYHPMCDSGTAWECGYAIGLEQNKTVIGYTTNLDSVPQEIVNNIHLLVLVQSQSLIYDIFDYIAKIKLRTIIPNPPKRRKMPYTLDPMFEDIQDANSVTSFFLGMRKGKDFVCTASLSDHRTMIQKYGTVDSNGIKFEDFGMPVNIMMALNSEIID